MKQHAAVFKVGGHFYDVFVTDVLTKGDILGCCDTNDLEIIVTTEIPRQRQEEVLIHELLHAMFYESGMYHRFDQDEEEYIVDNLAKVLYQVLKENDFSFLHEDEDVDEIEEEKPRLNVIGFHIEKGDDHDQDPGS